MGDKRPWVCPLCNTAYPPWISSCACSQTKLRGPIWVVPYWERPYFYEESPWGKPSRFETIRWTSTEADPVGDVKLFQDSEGYWSDQSET